MFRFFRRKRSKQPQRPKNNNTTGQQPKRPEYQTHSREPAASQHTKRPQPQYRTTSPTPTEKTLKELSEKIRQLEKTLERLSGGDSGFQNRVTIENLTMKEPVLKELAFELDRLKLDEVSGALNLGNNFGVEVGQNPNKKPKQNRENSSSDAKENGDESGFKKTGDGFQFRFGEQD